jgi:hypothetical protein
MSDGRQPDRLLFKSMISLRVADMFPRLGGMHPLRLLLAKTMTETGEFPRLEGISKSNLLLLISSSYSRVIFLKLRGTFPQNLLELIWKNARSVSRLGPQADTPVPG